MPACISERQIKRARICGQVSDVYHGVDMIWQGTRILFRHVSCWAAQVSGLVALSGTSLTHLGKTVGPETQVLLSF